MSRSGPNDAAAAVASMALEQHAQGTVIPVRAQAGARLNGLRGVHGGALKISVTQPPEKGKANQALIQTLAEALGASKQQIELIAGPTDSRKRFLVTGMSAEEVAARLTAALADAVG